MAPDNYSADEDSDDEITTIERFDPDYDVTITIRGRSELFFGQDLHTRAALSLIEGADIGGWQKETWGPGTDKADPGDRYLSDLLKAIARTYLRISTDVNGGVKVVLAHI